MSRATELADKLNSLCVAEFAWPHLNDAATELRRLDRVNAELVNELQWLRAYITRYDPPGLENHLAVRIDAALTSSTGDTQ